MKLRILCSGFLFRLPFGGHTWHHLQYLLGFRRLGHEVMFFEDFGWPRSLFDRGTNSMTDDPSHGIEYLSGIWSHYGLEQSWCFLSADGKSHGRSREELVEWCRSCDVYFNL